MARLRRDRKIEYQNTVKSTHRTCQQSRTYAFVVGMVLIGSKCCPICEIGDKAMQIAPFNLFRAFAAPRSERCGGSLGYPCVARIMSLAFSAIMMVAALVFDETTVGMMDASTTRSPAIPLKRNCGSTTAAASAPMRQVPTG
jgi:hypothetical protein